MNCNYLQVIELVVRSIVANRPEKSYEKELIISWCKRPSVEYSIRIWCGCILIPIYIVKPEYVVHGEIQYLLLRYQIGPIKTYTVKVSSPVLKKSRCIRIGKTATAPIGVAKS